MGEIVIELGHTDRIRAHARLRSYRKEAFRLPGWALASVDPAALPVHEWDAELIKKAAGCKHVHKRRGRLMFQIGSNLYGVISREPDKHQFFCSENLYFLSRLMAMRCLPGLRVYKSGDGLEGVFVFDSPDVRGVRVVECGPDALTVCCRVLRTTLRLCPSLGCLKPMHTQ